MHTSEHITFSETPTQHHQDFWVSVKGYIGRGNELLIVKVAGSEKWDLPGGRIHTEETETPFETTLMREIAEELGIKTRISVDEQFAVYKIYYPHLKRGVLTVAYRCKFLGGEIKLSHEHSELAWVDTKLWRQYQYCNNHDEGLQKYFGD